MATENPLFRDILSDLQLIADLYATSPFGFWVGHLASQSIIFNNTLGVSLRQLGQDGDFFRDAILGSEQSEFCFKQTFEEGSVHTQLTYVCDNGILSYEVELQQLEAHPDFFVALHPFEGVSPWPNDQLYYPYFLKLDAQGRYLFHSTQYTDLFLVPGKNYLGADSLADVKPSSQEAYLNTAQMALRNPGRIFEARLEKEVPKTGEIKITQWQFVSLLNCYGGTDRVYARGFDVSSLYRAEQSLLERQRELNYFFESDLMGVFFMMLPEPMDWDGAEDKWPLIDYAMDHQRITRCNKTVLNQYGYKDEEEFLNLRPRDFFSHDIEEGRKTWFEFFSKGRLHTRTEERKSNGEPVFIEGDYHILKDEQGRIVGHFGLQQDVTAQQRQTERYLETKEQLQKLTESIPGVVFQLEVDAQNQMSLRFLSKTFKNLGFDITEDVLHDDPSQIMQVVSPKDYSTLLGSIIYASRKQKELDMEFRVENRLGEERWFRVQARPESADPKFTQWYGILRPIDEKKESEREQLKLAQIARNTSDLMMLIGPEGNIDWFNSSCQRCFGWTYESVIGSSPEALFKESEDSNSKQQILRAVAEQRNMEQKLMLHTEQGFRWIRIRVKPIWNSNGEYLYCLMVMQDIHEEEIKSLEMEALLNLTSEQNKRLQSFTYIVSHNIRSHSANLQGLIEAIEVADDEIERKELWNFLVQVSGGLESTIQHLNEIIAINRNLNTSKLLLNLNSELDHVLNILGSEVHANRAEIIREFSSEADVFAVRAYLESALLNLLSNALRYRHPDRKPKIVVHLFEDDSYHYISVRDNGLGIDMQRYQERIFQLYQTFHSHPESRGLGLYILRNQIEAMGGNVDLKSTVGKGSEFTISLPKQKD